MIGMRHRLTSASHRTTSQVTSGGSTGIGLTACRRLTGLIGDIGIVQNNGYVKAMVGFTQRSSWSRGEIRF